MSTTQPELKNPSDWILHAEKIIPEIASQLNELPDTASYSSKIIQYQATLVALSQNHISIRQQSNIRNFYNLRNQFGQLLEQSGILKNIIKKQEDKLYRSMELLVALQHHDQVKIVMHDSAINRIYSAQFLLITGKIDLLQRKVESRLMEFAQLDFKCGNIMMAANAENKSINHEMDAITKNLLHAEEPSLLFLGNNKYPPFSSTFSETIRQKADLLLSYSKASLFDLILLRVVVLLFAFIPLMYVKRIYRKNEATVYTGQFRYVHKHTALMAPTIILILAPVLFHYPPMLLLDLLFMTVAFSVITIVVKENKSLSRKIIFSLLFFYVLLKIDNLLIDVTLADRIIFGLSIFTLFHFYMIIKWINDNNVRYKKQLTVILYVVMTAIFIGWVCNLTGNFILSKNITLTAFEGFIFIFMLYFAINGIGDYILMTGDFFHRKQIAIKPDLMAVHLNIKPYLILLAAMYWVIAFLVELNLFHFVAAPLIDYLSSTVQIAGFGLTIGFLIFVFVFLVLSVLTFSGIRNMTTQKQRS